MTYLGKYSTCTPGKGTLSADHRVAQASFALNNASKEGRTSITSRREHGGGKKLQTDETGGNASQKRINKKKRREQQEKLK